MLRTLAILYAILSFFGSLFVSEPHAIPAIYTPKSSLINQNAPKPPFATIDSKGLTIWEALRTIQFWQMWIMIISSATAGLNTAVIYKQFAATSAVLAGDQYQALVGGIGALFNGSGRIFWGNLADKVGFKVAFTMLTLFQMFMMITYQYSVQSKVLFALNTFALFFCLAGNLALTPPAVQRMFGPKQGPVIYGTMYSAFAIASVLGGMLTKALVKSFGYQRVFVVMAAMSLSSTFLVLSLKPTTTNYRESAV